MDDYEFYRSKQTGAAFTEERLKEFWGERFDVVDLRKGENIVDNQMWESEYLYICVFKKLGREKRIPFEVSVDPFYSQENMTRLKESVAQMEATGGTIHEVDSDD